MKKRNVKLVIEYKGTNYSGWQTQNNAPSIQDAIEKAIKKMTNEDVKLMAAGRTDTGVHAIGQVANFFTSNLQVNRDNFLGGLNYHLPNDIKIKNVEYVDENFHSRYSAKSRKYVYRVHRLPTALWQDYSHVFLGTLDIEKMQVALSFLIGKHDFTSFTIKKSTKEHHFCEIFDIGLYEKKEDILLYIHGNRFLHNMVRIIVGTVLEIGSNEKISPDYMKNILDAKDRSVAGITAPPTGLYFLKVEY